MEARFEHHRIPYPNEKHKGKPSPLEYMRYFRGDSPWKPSPRGGRTNCKIMDGEEVIATGRALCSHSDNFNYKIGRKIALGRAKSQL